MPDPSYGDRLRLGVSDKLWSLDDIVALIEAREQPPNKRGPYKKRAPKIESALSN